MTDPTQPINDESIDPGPDVDENVNGGDPDPALELDPDRIEDPGEDDPSIADQPPTTDNQP